MSDFETNPIGTMDQLIEVKKALKGLQHDYELNNKRANQNAIRADKAEAQVVLSNQQRDNWMESNARRTEQVDALKQENKRLLAVALSAKDETSTHGEKCPCELCDALKVLKEVE